MQSHEQPKKSAPPKKRNCVVVEDEDQMDIDSGGESDGKGALKEVEAREEPKAARHGPGNESLKHFYDPTPVVDRSKQKR